MDYKDIDVSVHGNVLTLRGERRLEEHAPHVRISLLLQSLYAEIHNPQVLDRLGTE